MSGVSSELRQDRFNAAAEFETNYSKLFDECMTTQGFAVAAPASTGAACEATANQANGEETFSGLVDRYLAGVMQDETVVEAQRAWSACMADQGYDVTSVGALASPIDTEQVASDRLAMTPADRAAFDADVFGQEVRAALSVVACDRAVYFPILESWAELERE